MFYFDPSQWTIYLLYFPKNKFCFKSFLMVPIKCVKFTVFAGADISSNLFISQHGRRFHRFHCSSGIYMFKCLITKIVWFTFKTQLEWDRLVDCRLHFEGRCFPGEQSVQNDVISSLYFAKLWFRICIWVKAMRLFFEFWWALSFTL